MAPQIIIVLLWFVSLLLTAYLHGKPKTDKHNIFSSLIATLINFLLLWWGGFFDVWFK
jgi:hypothetical protein